MDYRNLSTSEIELLKHHGCSAENWGAVMVKDPFHADAIYEVHFSGKVSIGILRPKGEKTQLVSPGLYHSVISNCEIGDNVRIADVKYIANYNIGEESTIERTDEISMKGESTFGNGLTLDVLNEGGGRDLIIYDRLSAQIAYMAVLYQHDPDFEKSLKSLITFYADTKRSATGTIGRNTVIRNSSVIRNVCIGNSAVVDGAIRLSEGTLASSEHDPAKIGEGVSARNFIIHHGSVVESYAMLDKVFVGQGVRIGKQFSAENSVFFANCEGFHGEAVSLFAGPYSVSHHKSTLLIAALTSFYNAGSGTNQSNHMYKLGPLHQGILERGSKTGSFAYLLWPCHVGAYSVVMGKHGSSFDTSEFPFSYITLENEKSFLTPGMNLITVGTRRDVEKWPSRDKRKSPEQLDQITFDWLNPLIVQKAIRASEILNSLYETTPKEQDSVSYKGVRIKRLLLKSCRRYYDMLVPVFLGEQLIRRLESKKALGPGSKDIKPEDQWIDMAGMVSLKKEIDPIIREIASGKISTLQTLHDRLSDLYDTYDEICWNWSVNLLSGLLSKTTKEFSKDDFIRIIQDWKENKIKLNNLILADAKKEFDQSSRIGYGMDGDDTARDKDFVSVRGTYEGNKFVKTLLEENKNIEVKAAKLIKEFS